MGTFRPIRTALYIYECLRLAFLVGAFVLLRPSGVVAFPWLAVLTPGALFLLMALFWRLDMPRYRVYCPLYITGKGIHSITIVFWLFYEKNSTMVLLSLGSRAAIIASSIISVLLLGDLISMALVAMMTGFFKTVVDFLKRPLFKN